MKSYPTYLTTALLGLLLSLPLWPHAATGAAQVDPDPAYTLVIRPDENGNRVDVSDFPTARLELTLLKDGAHYADELAENQSFEVFEDGMAVVIKDYDRTELPISLTIVYDVASYGKLDEGWALGKAIAQQLAKVAPQSATLQFCLTVGSPHCRPAQRDRAEQTLTLLYQGVAQTLDEQPAPLAAVLDEALEPDGGPEGVPIVIFLRDEDPGLVALNRLPPEDVLRRLNARNGALVMVDLNQRRDGDPGGKITDYLTPTGSAYYSTYGMLDCGDYSQCVTDFINVRLPYKRVITFDSRLFRDDAPHEVLVRFNSRTNDTTPDSASANFVFASVGGNSSLRPIVSSVSCAILGLAPLFLILLMVFMHKPPAKQPAEVGNG